MAVHLPPCSYHKPAILLVQAESQFMLSRITSQQREFYYVGRTVPAYAGLEVVDFLGSLAYVTLLQQTTTS